MSFILENVMRGGRTTGTKASYQCWRFAFCTLNASQGVRTSGTNLSYQLSFAHKRVASLWRFSKSLFATASMSLFVCWQHLEAMPVWHYVCNAISVRLLLMIANV